MSLSISRCAVFGAAFPLITLFAATATFAQDYTPGATFAHDLPGGGFIGGLMAAAAFYLQVLARGSEFVRHEVGHYLQPGIGVGTKELS